MWEVQGECEGGGVSVRMRGEGGETEEVRDEGGHKLPSRPCYCVCGAG